MKILMPNGLRIHGQSRGEARLLYDEIFSKKVYLRHGISIEEGDVIFDIGANIGMFTLFLGQKLDNFTAYAFEPVPETFEALSRNTQHLADRVVLYNLAVSDREGQQVFSYYPRLASFSTACPDRLNRRWADLRDILANDSAESESPGRSKWRWTGKGLRYWCASGIVSFASRKHERICQLTKLSTILSKHEIERVDLLKVDVEGSEWEVLRGIDDADWPKIRQLAIEVHDAESEMLRMSAWLEKRGFEVAADQDDMARRAPLFLLYARRKRHGSLT